MRLIFNKKGSEMVEASISMPIVILAIILLLRLFTFYIQIITSSINEHEKALEAWDAYNGQTMKTYESTCDVEMLKGGLLGFNLKKRINSKAYFFNEDNLVRVGDAIGKE